MHDEPAIPPTPADPRPTGHLLRRLFLLPVRFYQLGISPWLPGCCRFTPTCSQYFIEAVRTRGIAVGTAKGLWRILRCNPFCRGGYDPVD